MPWCVNCLTTTTAAGLKTATRKATHRAGTLLCLYAMLHGGMESQGTTVQTQCVATKAHTGSAQATYCSIGTSGNSLCGPTLLQTGVQLPGL